MANYTPAQLLEDFSLEMTGKDVPGLLEAAPAPAEGHPRQRHLPRQRRPVDASHRVESRS